MTDAYNGGFKYISSISLLDCWKKCSNDDNCKAITFLHGDRKSPQVTDTCYLFLSDLYKKETVDAKYYTSIEKELKNFKINSNTRLADFLNGGFNRIPNIDLYACWMKCKNYPTCKAVTYYHGNRRSPPQDDQCYIFLSDLFGKEKVDAQYYTSIQKYFKGFNINSNSRLTDEYNGGYKYLPSISLENCWKTCSNDDSCKAVTFLQSPAVANICFIFLSTLYKRETVDEQYYTSIEKEFQKVQSFEFDPLDCDYDYSGTEIIFGTRRNCNSVPKPTSYYSLYMLSIIIEGLRRLINIPQPRPRLIIPNPPQTNGILFDLVGSVSNTFEFNGRFAFRLLRSEVEENRRAQTESNYRRRQPEGNGLHDLYPIDNFATWTFYHHVIYGGYRTQFISASADFGRTMNLAIQQALNGFNRENDGSGRGVSRYFIQIDLIGLTNYYDLTDSNVFNEFSYTPFDSPSREVINFARRWSEILLNCYQSFIPSSRIVRSFEVYAVNTTHYIMNILENPAYINRERFLTPD